MAPRPLYDPSSGPMRYAAAISGSGTNYEKIRERDPSVDHVVFSNSPVCAGLAKARAYGAPAVCLDSAIYFREMWGIEKVPREGVERDTYHMALMTLVEQAAHGRPDLICLAGYDLWTGGWMVRKYYPRILNVHPGDAPTYTGLAWRPTAKAILAGEGSVKSTVFFVDESDDGGPILIQSAGLPLSASGRRPARHKEVLGQGGRSHPAGVPGSRAKGGERPPQEARRGLLHHPGEAQSRR